MGGTVTQAGLTSILRGWIKEDLDRWHRERETQLKDKYLEWAEAVRLLTNPPSSPPPTDTAEKLYLQIRICGEQYTGSKYVKKEYRIELPANVVGLGGEADIWEAKREGGTESMRYYLSTRELGAFVVIPVILQAPSSNSPEEATPTAPQFQYGWTGEKLS